MKFIITESQKEKAFLNWMNKNFSPDQLEVVEHPDYPGSIFYLKNGKVMMKQDLNKRNFWFSYNNIYSDFEKLFLMEIPEIKKNLSIWLEKTLGLNGYTPRILVS